MPCLAEFDATSTTSHLAGFKLLESRYQLSLFASYGEITLLTFFLEIDHPQSTEVSGHIEIYRSSRAQIKVERKCLRLCNEQAVL